MFPNIRIIKDDSIDLICTPIQGYYCPKCLGQQAFISPSGMLILCVNCPWQDCYPIPFQKEKETN